MLPLQNGQLLVDVPGGSAALVRLQGDKNFVPRSRRP
jgi:hypothetical protein